MVRKIIAEKKKYFASFWHVVDFVTAILSLLAIAVYAGRTIHTNSALNKINADLTKGNLWSVANYLFWNRSILVGGLWIYYLKLPRNKQAKRLSSSDVTAKKKFQLDMIKLSKETKIHKTNVWIFIKSWSILAWSFTNITYFALIWT